jgi:hypothetical protein
MARTEMSERKTPAKKKRNGGDAKSMLRSVVGGNAAADTLVDLVERLGLIDIVLGRVKSRIDETDMDELMDEATDYLRRNPEVLVVTLGAVTVATGLLVWLNNRREWDGQERRNVAPRPMAATPARARRASANRSDQ